MKHRSRIALCAVALLAVAAAPATADDTATDEPDASATAVEVDGVVTVSETTASEDASSATVLGVGDETVVGGDSADGDSSGEVVDTGDTELGRLSIGSWSATSDSGGSQAESSVASVTVRDEDTAQVTVLRSRSTAGSDGSGSAATSAAAVRLGGEDEIRILSTTWGQDGPSSALVRQGDDTIGEDPDGQCALEIPSVLHLLCLTGTDGLGGTVAPSDPATEETASIVEASLLGEQELAVLRAGGDPGTTTAASDSPDDGPSDTSTAPAPAPGGDTEVAAAPADSGGSLPVTGGGLGIAALALLLLALGVTLRRVAGPATVA